MLHNIKKILLKGQKDVRPFSEVDFSYEQDFLKGACSVATENGMHRCTG